MCRHIALHSSTGRARRRLAPIACLLAVFGAAGASAQTRTSDGPWKSNGTDGGEWRSYAGDIAGTKYSPLDRIDAGNFERLEVGRRCAQPVDPGRRRVAGAARGHRRVAGGGHPGPVPGGPVAEPSRLQATPLMVRGVLYFNTPLSFDAATGETLWVFNPKSYEEGTPSMSGPWTQRGVAY